MKRGKKVVSLMLQALVPVALGACSNEAPLEDGTSQPTAEQVLPGIKTTMIADCPIDQPCEPTCPVYMAVVGMCDEPPPPPIPSMPSGISYPSYNRTGSFTVSWNYALNGETYELQEQVNQGSWQSIYQGYGSTFTVSGRSPAAYNYRVRSCNVSGCGSFRTGIATVVNPPQTYNLYGQYPFLYTHDQQNAQYAASAQSFYTGFTQSAGIASEGDFQALDVVDGKFFLGQGYNLTKDELSQICLNTADPNFQVVSNPLFDRSFTVERSTSTTHLAQLLDVDLSGGLSLGLKNFSLDATGSKKRLSEQVSDIYQEKLVARWEYKLDQWTLNTVAEPLRADFVSSMLIPNNANAQANFRERCGDKYIHSVKRGARLYMVFSFDAKKYSSTEREQKAATLKLKIAEVLNASGANAVTTETKLFLDQTGVTIKGYAVGGNKSTIEVNLSTSDFGTKFQEFINGVTPANVAAIEPSMSHYPQPSQFLNYNYFQIFADYRTPAEQLRRWHAIDLEREQRCKLMEAYGQNLANCQMAVAELTTAKLRCIETLSWSQCQHPLAYYTGVGTGGMGPSTLLYNWLGSNITSLERQLNSQYFTHHVGSSWGSKSCASYTDNTCLPSSACVIDTTQGAFDGINQGFSYEEYEWDGPGSGSFRNHTLDTVNKCIRTDSKLCTSTFGDGTADLRFTQGIYGQCPTTRSFAIVN